MNTILHTVNLVLALLGVLASFGALNKMQWRVTRPCICLAMLLIFGGFVAQFLGKLLHQWPPFADTALFGGVVALLVATQREPSWFLERWKNPAASIVAILAGAIALVALLGGCTTVPIPDCPPIPAQAIRTPQGIYMVLDMRGVQALIDRQHALQAGRCRMPKLQAEPASAPAPEPAGQEV